MDAIGISSHAAYYSLIEELTELVRDNGLNDVPVVCGGNIPKQQVTGAELGAITSCCVP